jgi:hypothetical protein
MFRLIINNLSTKIKNLFSLNLIYSVKLEEYLAWDSIKY